ncbi:glycosyl transferase family group 2-domain-containing protein [Neurospora tetraspora]|uniref:Glycosyl transferase family group 2-domain-containing protein n=1 Tax=Neurospora tetraspora TaxID=94610 RepID=A0AAE0JEW8_9PEZI|nr:glycosyl transferase family group 2-domain-containing protein [Neurospora tetraspora]
MTVNSRVIKTFLQWSPEAIEVPLNDGLRIQILPTVDDLLRARKHQAKHIESALMQLVWKDGNEVDDEEESAPPMVERIVEVDAESGEPKREKRPVHLLNTYLVSITLLIVTVSLRSAWRQLAIEVMVDGDFVRLALVVLAPVQIFFTLFFAQVIVDCLAQIFGPIQQLSVNSKFYSAKLPPRLQTPTLPHVTVQCLSTKKASPVSLLPQSSRSSTPSPHRQERIEFYADHSIGWVARPRHGENGFQRRSKFKKAPNMNFALMISCKVEEKLSQIQRSPEWSQHDEAQACERALQEVLEEDGRAWTDGNIRMGDYILLIDSDTRVSADYLLDTVLEMEQSSDVGIMQFSSGAMQVVHTYFENGITFFTNLISSAIRYTVSNGDVAPFVGYNAILRWSAIQQVSYGDEDGYEKLWSESHVSEDFDIALRL